MFYISSPFGLSCPAHLSISSTELITFQLFCSFQPLHDYRYRCLIWLLLEIFKEGFIHVSWVWVYFIYISFIDESYWIKKKKEIVIELVHHIRPPVRTQDRDKYKKKTSWHLKQEKSFSYSASSSKRDHNMNLLV